MTKLLEKAIAKVREFPDEDQDAFAAALLSMAGEETPVVHLDDETARQCMMGLRKRHVVSLCPTRRWKGFSSNMIYEIALHAALAA